MAGGTDVLTAGILLAVVWGGVLGQEVLSEGSNHRTNTTTTIAFGSCHKNRKAAIPSIWEVMLDQQQGQSLDAFVWTGDAVYPPQKDPVTGRKRYGPSPVQELEAAFHELKTNATIGYTRLLKQGIPVYGTWDDHDYGGNDMGRFLPNQAKRAETFWDFLGYKPALHEDSQQHRRGVYHSIDLEDGRLKLILLDTRSFREDHCVPSLAYKVPLGNALACATRWATAGLHLWKYASWWGYEDCTEANILGEEQWEWLEKELLSSTADLNIIVSSVQVWSTNPAMESWGQFPLAQSRLWDLLEHYYHGSHNGDHAYQPRSSKRGPVVVWSGDVHHAEIIGQPGYLEITSSGMTHHCGQPFLYGKMCQPLLEQFSEHRHTHNDYYIGLNYGLLRVNWEKQVATFQIKRAFDGTTVLEVEQPLNLMATDFRLPPLESLPKTWNGHLIPWAQRVLFALVVGLGIASRLLRDHRLK